MSEWAVNDLVMQMGAGYGRLLESREENFAMWHGLNQKWGQRIRALHEGQGFVAARAFSEALYRRVTPLMPNNRAELHVDLMAAYSTPWDEIYWQHVLERISWGGNVVIQFTGPTGMGKSSLAIGQADRIRRIEPAQLPNHLVFDLATLPDKLAALEPGAVLVIDEYLRTSGDNSRTTKEMIENLEDTIRASQKSLFWLSPSKKDHDTAQIEMEIFAWNRETRMVRAVCWVEGIPMGFVTLPWARKELWDVYSPWKNENVARSVAAVFQDRRAMIKIVLEMAERKEFISFLTSGSKPKKKDFDTAFSLYYQRSLSVRGKEALVDLAHTVCYNWNRLGGEQFEAQFGARANKGLEEIARKCYPEN